MTKTVGVVSLATNRYLKYWMAMALSAEEFLFPQSQVTLHVFTDQIDEVRSFESQLSRIRINALPIGSLVWPAAPLQKFQVIVNHFDELDQDILMHLDADMLMTSKVEGDLHPDEWQGGMALVKHPGYRRPSGKAITNLYAKHPSFLAKDAYRKLSEGAIGTWESDRTSTAYVPRHLRKVYVCGATWMGTHDSFRSTCELLAENTKQDERAGHIARWHDESHMNWFAATHDCSILDSEYCYVEGAQNLADLSPKIIAVEKFDDRTR